MTDGMKVELGPLVEVIYQLPYNNEDSLPEPAVILRRYDQDGPVYALIQGDQEITIGGQASLQLIGRAMVVRSKEAL